MVVYKFPARLLSPFAPCLILSAVMSLVLPELPSSFLMFQQIDGEGVRKVIMSISPLLYLYVPEVPQK